MCKRSDAGRLVETFIRSTLNGKCDLGNPCWEQHFRGQLKFCQDHLLEANGGKSEPAEHTGKINRKNCKDPQKRIEGPDRLRSLYLSAFRGEWATFLSGDPNGIRTRVTPVKGECPRPLDDRVVSGRVENALNRHNFKQSYE